VQTTPRATSLLAICVLAAACGDDITETITQTVDPLAVAADEPAGENCEFGGTALSVGADDDGNGTLDTAEVDSTTYVCAPAAPDDPPIASRTSTSAESPGENCENGGIAVASGLDLDGDGTLGPDEVLDTEYICLPADAPVGTAPELLSDAQYLGAATAECLGGFVRTTFGLDVDASGTLGEDEVAAAFLSCNQRPTIELARALRVDDCTVETIIPTTTSDLDGDVTERSLTVVRSGSPLSPTLADDGTITIAAGDHLGTATFELRAVDNWGASNSATIAISFVGNGCRTLDRFYGVDPTTCASIEVDNVAGDDRGRVTASRSYLYYNGDDGLVRTDLNLENLELVVPVDVDTLASNPTTGQLMSLWSSSHTFTSVLDSAAALEDCCGNEVPLDQLVVLDEETLEVTSTVALEQTIPSPDTFYDAFDLPDLEPLPLEVNDVLFGLREERLAVLWEGYDTLNDRRIYGLWEYDTDTGELLNTRYLFEGDGGLGDAMGFDRQEVSLQAMPLYLRDAAAYLVVRDNDAWYEVNFETGERALVSDSFASTCDVQNLEVDPTGTRVYFHSEDGCFGPAFEETMGYCDVLAVPNDGSVNDQG
jgi:hypothetical protein